MPLLRGTGRREDAIRRRAYEIYLARIGKGESADERQDWFEAERWVNAEVQFERLVGWIGDPNL
jgi:hypothetical protein